MSNHQLLANVFAIACQSTRVDFADRRPTHAPASFFTAVHYMRFVVRRTPRRNERNHSFSRANDPPIILKHSYDMYIYIINNRCAGGVAPTRDLNVLSARDTVPRQPVYDRCDHMYIHVRACAVDCDASPRTTIEWAVHGTCLRLLPRTMLHRIITTFPPPQHASDASTADAHRSQHWHDNAGNRKHG